MKGVARHRLREIRELRLALLGSAIVGLIPLVPRFWPGGPHPVDVGAAILATVIGCALLAAIAGTTIIGGDLADRNARVLLCATCFGIRHLGRKGRRRRGRRRGGISSGHLAGRACDGRIQRARLRDLHALRVARPGRRCSWNRGALLPRGGRRHRLSQPFGACRHRSRGGRDRGPGFGSNRPGVRPRGSRRAARRGRVRVRPVRRRDSRGLRRGHHRRPLRPTACARDLLDGPLEHDGGRDRRCRRSRLVDLLRVTFFDRNNLPPDRSTPERVDRGRGTYQKSFRLHRGFPAEYRLRPIRSARRRLPRRREPHVFRRLPARRLVGAGIGGSVFRRASGRSRSRFVRRCAAPDEDRAAGPVGAPGARRRRQPCRVPGIGTSLDLRNFLRTAPPSVRIPSPKADIVRAFFRGPLDISLRAPPRGYSTAAGKSRRSDGSGCRGSPARSPDLLAGLVSVAGGARVSFARSTSRHRRARTVVRLVDIDSGSELARIPDHPKLALTRRRFLDDGKIRAHRRWRAVPRACGSSPETARSCRPFRSAKGRCCSRRRVRLAGILIAARRSSTDDARGLDRRRSGSDSAVLETT